MDSAETLLQHRIEHEDLTRGGPPMISGMNVNTGAGLEATVLTAEQYDILPVSAKIGGTQPTSIIPLMPVGLIVAGIIGATLLGLDPDAHVRDARIAPIEIS